ncbi:MAG: winged helix-turn-helix transcriptional regulator [Candidatus Thorarchaeota archaeon]|nr:winged helix-turn-helix transcriptional regulator [Candidatus Thorarchaeota archaeon]
MNKRFDIDEEIETLRGLKQEVQKELNRLRKDRKDSAVQELAFPEIPSSTHEELTAVFDQRVKRIISNLSTKNGFPAPKDITAERLADLITPLANEDRIKIIRALGNEPMTFTELESLVNKKGGALKHHLDQLIHEGYVVRKRVRGHYLVTVKGNLVHRMLNWIAASVLEMNDAEPSTPS